MKAQHRLTLIVAPFGAFIFGVNAKPVNGRSLELGNHIGVFAFSKQKNRTEGHELQGSDFWSSSGLPNRKAVELFNDQTAIFFNCASGRFLTGLIHINQISIENPFSGNKAEFGMVIEAHNKKPGKRFGQN